MNPELQGFLFLLRLHKFMTLDLDPIHDLLLANLPATDDDIAKAFRSDPRAKRVRANGVMITKQEWCQRKVESNGKLPGLVK